MKAWRGWKIGDRIVYFSDDEFDCFREEGKVSEIYADHAIVRCDGMNLWADDDTAEMFLNMEAMK